MNRRFENLIDEYIKIFHQKRSHAFIECLDIQSRHHGRNNCIEQVSLPVVCRRSS